MTPVCARKTRQRSTRFANDLLNLTLSDPAVNRYQKGAKDAGEWMPQIDPRAFAETVIRVKRKYGLSIDPRGAEGTGESPCRRHSPCSY